MVCLAVGVRTARGDAAMLSSGRQISGPSSRDAQRARAHRLEIARQFFLASPTVFASARVKRRGYKRVALKRMMIVYEMSDGCIECEKNCK
jgi:hypothetical protein